MGIVSQDAWCNSSGNTRDMIRLFRWAMENRPEPTQAEIDVAKAENERYKTLFISPEAMEDIRNWPRGNEI